MENPWKNLPDSPPYVLDCDREAVEAFNQNPKLHEDHSLQLQAYPEPFMGNLDAPVVLLGLNPSFDKDRFGFNKPIAYPPETLAVLKKSLNHEELDFPFYFLDPELKDKKHSGTEWWDAKLRTLLKTYNDDHFIANNLLNIEFFPYHSRKANAFHKKGHVASQQYAFYLVNKAIERKATIIVKSVVAQWLNRVPALKDYKDWYKLNAPLVGSITPNNCPEGYKRIKERFDEVKKATT